MIRYVILGIALTCAFVGYSLFSKQAEDTNLVEATAPKPVQSILSAPKAATPSANSINQGREAQPTKSDIKDLQVSDPDPILDEQMLASSPWQVDDDPPVVPDRYQRKGLNVTALKLDRSKLSAIRSGDQLAISIPQTNRSYEMQVEQVGRHMNGDRSLKGHLLNMDMPYSVIMTEGADTTYATINTPDGSFLLEANGENGWIMSLAELDNLMDPSLKDYQIPNITR